MTFFVGKALFSEPVGLWSAVLVGVLPSFFLQATHSAKDALYIGGQLLILHAITLLVEKVQNKRTLSIIAANSMIGLLDSLVDSSLYASTGGFPMALRIGDWRCPGIKGEKTIRP